MAGVRTFLPPGEGIDEERLDWRGRLVSWLLARGPIFYALVVLVASLGKYGAGVFPSWDIMRAFAQHWQDPMSSPLLRPPAGYLLGSPTSAVVAGVLHLSSARAYLGFHLVLAAAAIVAPFALQRARQRPELRLALALLLVGGAVPAVLLDWVGSYDPVSLAAAATAVLATNRVVAGAAWAVFAFNNAPEAAVALIIYSVVLWSADHLNALERVGTAAAGAICGYLGVRALTSAWHGGESQLTMFQHYGYSRFLHDAVGYWPIVTFSALGVGWLFLLDRRVWAMACSHWLVGMSVVTSLALPLVVLDASRLVASTLWPSVLVVTDRVISTLSRADIVALLGRLLPFALVVVVLDWDGTLVYAGWDYLLHLLGFLVGLNHSPS